jgi:hypothetical protein
MVARHKLTKQKKQQAQSRAGKIKYAALAWLFGLPLPIILIALFWGGCDF